MRIEGRIFKSGRTGRFWAVEIPLLGVHTQGRTKDEAFEMAKDAVELIVDRDGFEAQIAPKQAAGEFLVLSNNTKYMIATILRNLRLESGLTAKQVVQRMGEKSETGYLRYERGESMPSIEKLDQILMAIDPASESVLKIG